MIVGIIRELLSQSLQYWVAVNEIYYLDEIPTSVAMLKQ